MSTGAQIAGYRLEELIGRGGMGVVYRAHDLALERSVALKLLAPELASDVGFRERFLVESRLAASLDHPNVVPIFDAGEVEGQLYLAMRYVQGSDLKELLQHQGALEPARAIQIVSQVAEGLDGAHARGLVHRDVKPSNVLLDEAEHAYLADFGLTRRLADQAPGFDSGLSLGTPAYVAPEQIEDRDVDGRADQYSLACLLCECLSGEPPFPRSSEAAVLYAHLEERPSVPPGLEQVMAKALAKDPSERYGSCRELVEAARAALGLEPKRTRWPLVAALGLVLVGAALLAFFLTRSGGGPQAEPGADSLVRIDPQTNKVTETMPVGRKASGVAAAGGYVWVTNAADGTVWRIDPKTRAALRIPVQGSPTGVAANRVSVLVANSPEHTLASVDSADGSVSFVSRLPGDASGSVPVAAGSGGLWFADATGRMAAQLTAAARGGQPAGRIEIAADQTSFLTAYQTFDGLAAGEGAVWAVGDSFGRTIWRIDPLSQGVVASIALPFVPGHVAAGEGAVWLTSLLDGRLARIDPATDRITAVFRVGRDVSAIASGQGAVWVASAIDRTVARIDPRTNRIVARVPISQPPTEIAAGAGGVWVTTAKSAPRVPRNSIGIGIVADCAGPYATWYDESIAGAELVLLHHGGRRAGPRIRDGIEGARIAGKPVTLALGCSDGTATSVLAEARRLVDQVGVHVLIGPTNANEELALQDYARRRPGVAFVDGVAGGQLLRPAPNFFSFLPDGATWMAGFGAYAYRTLGWRRAVTIGDVADSGFNWTQAAGFTAEFCSLGGTIAKRVWVPPGTQDYSAVVAQIPKRGVDGIVATTGPETVVALAKEYPGLRGNLARKLLLGAIAFGGGVDQLDQRYPELLRSFPSSTSRGAAGQRYTADLGGRFPHLFASGVVWDIAYRDAMAATAQALQAVHGDLSGGERRFQAVLARVKLDSPSGPIRLDSSRQAVGSNYLVFARDPASSVYRRMDGVEHTFGGYFSASDPPPGRSTPACKRAKPPPWTRGDWTASARTAPKPTAPVSAGGAATAPASIAGATLGLAESDYRRILGKPVRYQAAGGGEITEPGFQQPANYARLVFGKRKIDVYFQDRVNQAILITTWSKAFRTAEGVGPCSTFEQLKAAYGDRLKPNPGNTDPYKGTVYSYIVGRSLIFELSDPKLPNRHVTAVALYDGSGPRWKKPGSPLFYASFVASAPDQVPCG